jgi:hypothetical protein
VWNNSGLTNRFKTFLFKFFNNLLGINTRISHFVPDATRKCTFCTVNNELNAEDETFLHLFLDCKYTKKWHEFYLNKYLPDVGILTETERKKLWFLGILPQTNTCNNFTILSILGFQFRIWESKLCKKTPSGLTLDIKYRESIFALLRRNKSAREGIEKITNVRLCREFGSGFLPAAPDAAVPVLAGGHNPLPEAVLPLPPVPVAGPP